MTDAQTLRKARNNGARADESDGKGNDFHVPLSAGFMLHVRRPSPMAIQAVLDKAHELYPMPDPPKEKITSIDGTEEEVSIGSADPRYTAFLRAQNNALTEQNQYVMEFLFQRRITLTEIEEGHTTQEAVIAQFANDLTEIREWGEVDPELDEWQATLRYCLISTPEEYGYLAMIAGMVSEMSDISSDEVLHRVRSFRY